MKDFDLTRNESIVYLALFLVPVAAIGWLLAAPSVHAWLGLPLSLLAPASWLLVVTLRRIRVAHAPAPRLAYAAAGD